MKGRFGFLRAAAAALALCATLLGAAQARAFCGFYVSGADAKLFNDATNVVLMREGTRTVLSMQNAYKGPPDAFAMVVPVPVVLQKENVKTLPRAIFDRVDQLAAPRLVEYWEQDPCAVREYDRFGVYPSPKAGAVGAGAPVSDRDYGVKIEAQFTVGEYEIVILSAKDSTGLDAWLRDSHYKIPAGAEPYLRPYVQAGSKFFVAKVDPAKVAFEQGRALLSPLRFHYDSDTFALPIRLGLVNSSGTQDLIVNILARGQRYEAANYPNVTITTNVDVAEDARDRFGAFYAALFDRTLEHTPRAVVTEYSWDSGSCDPCPVPPLEPGELATLGADALGSTASAEAAAPPPPLRWGGGFVLTRLHARYAKESLGEDIVFRAAPPVEGGREWSTAGGTLEKGARPSSMNNFQARYAIRHRWQGAVACENPQFGVWGGPPGGGTKPPMAAAKLAMAPRGGLALPKLLREDVPDLGIKADFTGLPGTAPSPAETTAPAASSEPPPAPRPKSCGCNVVSGEGALASGLAASGLLGLLAVRRRRRV
jgi:MYXO-CTERM domain-containing protein